jgi:hypothetical protein
MEHPPTYGGGMLQLRIEGDQGEALALTDALRAARVEVQIGTTKTRGGFVHVYTTARMPWYQPVPDPAPLRVQARVGRPTSPALTDGRPTRGRRR